MDPVERTVNSVKKVPEIGKWHTNYSLFIQIYFIAFKVGPSRNNKLVPTNNLIIKTFFKTHFPEPTSVLAANSLLCLLSTKNGCIEVIIWLLEREKSRAEPYQVNTVVVWWYSLSFWPEIRSQWYTCEMVFRNKSGSNGFHAQTIV